MRLFLYPKKDSIANTSVKTPLNCVKFTIFKSIFILAEHDLGFSFAKFKMADQCEASEGSTKDALKREKSKFQRGIWNAHTLKDLGKTFHELNKLAESVVKGNFGALRERTNYYGIGEIMSYASTKHGSRKDRSYSPS